MFQGIRSKDTGYLSCDEPLPVHIEKAENSLRLRLWRILILCSNCRRRRRRIFLFTWSFFFSLGAQPFHPHVLSFLFNLRFEQGLLHVDHIWEQLDTCQISPLMFFFSFWPFDCFNINYHCYQTPSCTLCSQALTLKAAAMIVDCNVISWLLQNSYCPRHDQH